MLGWTRGNVAVFTGCAAGVLGSDRNCGTSDLDFESGFTPMSSDRPPEEAGYSARNPLLVWFGIVGHVTNIQVEEESRALMEVKFEALSRIG